MFKDEIFLQHPAEYEVYEKKMQTQPPLLYDVCLILLDNNNQSKIIRSGAQAKQKWANRKQQNQTNWVCIIKNINISVRKKKLCEGKIQTVGKNMLELIILILF